MNVCGYNPERLPNGSLKGVTMQDNPKCARCGKPTSDFILVEEHCAKCKVIAYVCQACTKPHEHL